MIASQLNGGLGNQLFQYAIVRAVAEKRGELPLLDLTLLLQKSSSHPYYLSHFNIITETNSNLLKRWWFHNFQKQGLFLVAEDNTILNSFPKTNFLLKGYWQNRFYFEAIKSLLVNEIQPIKEIESAFISKICNTESVALHIRRGDFVGSNLHDLCTEKYYINAIDFIKGQVPKAIFFVFSDDMAYCKSFLERQPNCIFVEAQNTVTAFWLMKQCEHFILSNSSFSWWAQYLNVTKKIVVAPPKWFNDSSINTSGIYLDDWKIIALA